MENEHLELALEYLARGWSVIPCGKNKRPLISWKKYQTERATEQEIREWFTNPDAQIGIVTGAISNLTVVDVESEGDTRMFTGIETYTVKTGGSGWHYYFENEADMQNAVRTLPFIDVRSEGGYVIAGGSESEKGGYAVIEESPVVKMPEYIKRAIAPAVVAEHSLQKPMYPLEHITDYPGYGEGQRNNEMTRYIGVLLKRMHSSVWESVVWPMVESANTRNTPPLTEVELTAIFNSIAGRERAKPDGGFQLMGLGNDTPEAIPEITPDEAEEAVGHILDVAQAQKINTDICYKTNIPMFDAALLGGFWPGDLVVIAGEPGNGKTTFGQDITMSLARNDLQAPSLWFSYEVLPRPLANKFLSMGLTPEDCIYMPYSREENTTQYIERLSRATVAAKGIKAIFVDHIGRVVSERAGSRAGDTEMNKKSIEDLKNVALRLECVVVVMAHVAKTHGRALTVRDIRDTSAIEGEADVVFLIERLKNSRDENMAQYFSEGTRITLGKNRHDGATPSAIFQLVDGRFVTDEASQQRYAEFAKSRSDAEDVWNNLTKDD